MFVHVDNPLPEPLLIIVILCLAVIFSSFTLFAEPNIVVAMASLVYALLVSSALFLIVDMSQPFSGLMKISSQPLQRVLPPLGS
jgi:type IV secretory pathway VirB2 component (pilin)